jgi:thioredoxin 1
VVFLVLGFVTLSIALQVMARRRAAKLEGQQLPSLPGAVGARITGAATGLVYFFTPTCAACRPITPRMKAMAERGGAVFPIDATQDPQLAAAFSVMATPTTVEVKAGRVVKVHIGPVPAELFARYSGEGSFAA